MTIQLDVEWTKDNLTETAIHMTATEPAEWIQGLEPGVPDVDAVENFLLKRLEMFLSFAQIPEGPLSHHQIVNVIYRPVWASIVLNENAKFVEGDLVLGNLRDVNNVQARDAGYRVGRSMTVRSESSRVLSAQVVFLTRL